MGNFLQAASTAVFLGSRIQAEGRAIDQLNEISTRPGVGAVAGFADLHPGRQGPVGMAFWSDRIHPLPIGGDIGCGILAVKLNKPARKISVDKAVRAWSDLDAPYQDASSMASSLGLSQADARVLGTVGGGNHFIELGSVGASPDGAPVSRGDSILLIHSGSRGLGEAALMALPKAGDGLYENDEAARIWLTAHDNAVIFARANRIALASRAAQALGLEWEIVADAVHNAVVPWQGGWLHRKGAADATGQWVPVAGSRSTPSWIVSPNKDAPLASLASMPHGSGRKWDRSACHGRFKALKRDKDGSVRPQEGGRVLCADRSLLVEETSGAYKDSQRVAEAIEEEGIGYASIRIDPMLTFKSGVVR